MKLHLPFDLSKYENMDKDTSRLAIWISTGIVTLMIISACIMFFLSLKGAEQTLVPDVKGMDLTQALIAMQEKELYPRIQLRFSDKVNDRNTILDQKPAAGTIVKAGRRINLVVSRGVVLDKVENYVGQDINSVRIHLQTQFSGQAKPLIAIKDPLVYVYDKAPAGTILQQKPEPGKDITGPVALELVISQGAEKAQVKVPSLVGLSIANAISELQKSKALFTFSIRKPDAKEKAGVVVSQMPQTGIMMPSGNKINVVVSELASTKDTIFGLFTQNLPSYPYPLRLNLDAILPSNERISILSMDHPGGELSVPYQVPNGTILVLSIMDKEMYRTEIKAE